MKFNVEIKCNEKSKVQEEKLYGYIIRAIGGVVASNDGIIKNITLLEEYNGSFFVPANNVDTMFLSATQVSPDGIITEHTKKGEKHLVEKRR